MDHSEAQAQVASGTKAQQRLRRSRPSGRASEPQTIPADVRSGVLEGLAEVERGEFTDAVELAAVLRRYNP